MAIIGYSAFNGLVVLPVILALVNPASYESMRDELGLHDSKRSDRDGGKAKFSKRYAAVTCVTFAPHLELYSVWVFSKSKVHSQCSRVGEPGPLNGCCNF
jgi:hypothetical protein